MRLDGSEKGNSEPEREVRGQMGVEREFLIPRKQKRGRTKAAQGGLGSWTEIGLGAGTGEGTRTGAGT